MTTRMVVDAVVDDCPFVNLPHAWRGYEGKWAYLVRVAEDGHGVQAQWVPVAVTDKLVQSGGYTNGGEIR